MDFSVSTCGKKQLRALTREHRKGVFDVLRQVAESENPYSLPDVKKLEGELAPLRRIRAGSHRIFFQLNAIEIIQNKTTYKGRLEIIAIHDRKAAY